MDKTWQLKVFLGWTGVEVIVKLMLFDVRNIMSLMWKFLAKMVDKIDGISWNIHGKFIISISYILCVNHSLTLWRESYLIVHSSHLHYHLAIIKVIASYRKLLSTKSICLCVCVISVRCLSMWPSRCNYTKQP